VVTTYVLPAAPFRADNALRRAPAPHIAFTHDRARVGFDDAMDAKLKKRQAVPVAV
jgi:hypothetical protein